jgi:hypothetical protein
MVVLWSVLCTFICMQICKLVKKLGDMFVTCEVGRDLGASAQFFTPDLVLE